MRTLIGALVVLAGCATRQPPTLSVPEPTPERVTVVARAAPRTGAVQPIAVAVTNGRREAIRLDARQIYAQSAAGERVAPLPPDEAARRAGGTRLPGAVKGGAVGAATGGALGAVAGAISGAIQGGLGAAVAVGSAVGATLGAITGVLGGPRDQSDVAGFESRALASTQLASGTSATGYVYYPAGSYPALEVLIPDGGGPVRERAEIAAE
jgi:hypothetical protein